MSLEALYVQIIEYTESSKPRYSLSVLGYLIISSSGVQNEFFSAN